MKANLKVFGLVFIFMLIVSMACSSATPTVAPTVVPPTAVPVQPTYTPYPTYTPLPTAVPPTAVPPTKVPTQPAPTAVPLGPSGKMPIPANIVEISCGNTAAPAGVSSMRCFGIDNGTGAGMVFLNAHGKALGISAAWDTNGNAAYDCGVFIAWAANEYGWNVNDAIGAVGEIQNTGVWYSYGSIKASMTTSTGTVIILIEPSGGSGA